MNYKETGNKIPISSEELMSHVHKELAIYDRKIAITKVPSTPNPYTDPIIYKTAGNKVIRIPDDIQKMAIHIWYQRNGTNVPAMQQPPAEHVEPMKLTNNQKKIVYVHEDGYDTLKLSILIITAIIAAYLFFQMRRNSMNNMSNNIPMRYYLVR